MRPRSLLHRAWPAHHPEGLCPCLPTPMTLLQMELKQQEGEGGRGDGGSQAGE